MTINAVLDLGMDNTGEECNSVVLQEFLDVNNDSEIYFPAGEYYFSQMVETNAKNIRLIGDGHLANMGDAPTVFCSDQPISAILWWNGSSTNSNMNGPRIDTIQFQDCSPSHNLLRSAIRLTATANTELHIGLQNLVPQRHVQGTVSLRSNSKTVTGMNTNWSNRMRPGWFVFKGYPYEIQSIDSPFQLTLAIKYQGQTQVGPYAISYGGVGIWLEPGTDFTQYGKDWSVNGRCGCALFASAGSTSPKFTGTSRIKVKSGYINGEGIPDSMGCYLGPFSDTFQWEVAMNSYTYGIVIANGHQHDISHVDIENAGPPPPATGGPTGHPGTKGVLVMSDNSSDTYGNRIINNYIRQIGTAIELVGIQGNAPTQTKIAFNTFRSNTTNFINGNATNTVGEIDGQFYGKAQEAE